MENEKFAKTSLRYELEGVVGQGTFGKVYKGRLNSEIYGIKHIHSRQGGLHITTIREIKYLRSLNHKNIIKLIEINIENEEVYLIFPFYRFDLHAYLKKNIPNRREIIHIFRQSSEGLEYLHNKNIIHRDFKSTNLLMDFNLNVKIADFGMATTTNKNNKYSPGVVTLWYRPPEILLNTGTYNHTCDIWGLGCILGELLQGTPLFIGNTDFKVLESIVSICGSINNRTYPGIEDVSAYGSFNIPQSQRNLKKIYKNSYDDIVNLLDKILIINPSARISLEEILKDKIFDNYDSECINNMAKMFQENNQD
jgi:serine/threonine protein kinase